MEKINHYMMKHLARVRESQKYKEFKYRKTLKDAISKRGEKSKVIAWEVMYNDSYICTLDTLKEVKQYIEHKANT